MNIIRLQPDITGTVAWPTLSASKKSVVTVGVFDGVHRGHQAVIEETVRIAQRERCFSVVIMFDPRPAFVHAYAAKNGGMEPRSDVQDTQKITGVDERLRMMNALHVDYLLIVRYDLEFAAKSFRFFLGQLVGKRGMRTLVLGEDARMGANLEGTGESIGRLAEGTGVFELVVVPDHGGHVFVPQQAAPRMPEGRGEPADPLEGLSKTEQRALTKRLNSKKVRVLSSTNVRWLLGQGRVMAANDVLGYTHGVEGTVVHGEERGRTIGFPTANVETPIDGYLPVDGVYAGWLIDLGPADDYDESQRAYSEAPEADAEPVSQQYTSGGVEHRLAEYSPYRWPAAISIGRKPTFNEQSGHDERVLEAYALTDDWLELYGHRVRCEFVGFLRPQIKFDSADDLVAELKRNAEETKELTSRAS